MKTLSSLGNCDVRLKSGEKIWGEVSEVEICGDICLQVVCLIRNIKTTIRKNEWESLESLTQEQITFRTQDPHSFEAIKRRVCKVMEVDVSIFTSKSRPEHVAWPRQIAMFLCHCTGKYSLNTIGSKFGGRDHGTVIYACKRVMERMETEPSVHGLVIELARPLQISIPTFEKGKL